MKVHISGPTCDSARQSSGGESECERVPAASIEGGSPSVSPIKFNVGKLKELHFDLKQLSWDDKYLLLNFQLDSNPSSYPRTRPYPSSLLRQFQPSWMNCYPWLHYSRSLDRAFFQACVCLLQARLEVRIWGSLLQRHLSVGQRCSTRPTHTLAKSTTSVQ